MDEVVLVDSDILIDHLRGYRSIGKRGITAWAYSVITRAELFGGTDREDRVQRLLSGGVEVDVTRPIAERAGIVKHACGVALPDALIAATALLHDLVLVTRNLKHFEGIPGLIVQPPGEDV